MSIVLMTFGVVAAVILGAYWIAIVLPESQEQSALKKRLKSGDPTVKSEQVRLLKDPQVLSQIDLLHTVLTRLDGISTPVKRLLDEAGLDWTVGTFVLMSTTAMLAAAGLVNWYFRISWLAIVAGAVAAGIPLMVTKNIRKRRILKFEEQFPEAVDLIARSMRAGHAFTTGLKMVGEEMPEPVGTEIKLVYERQNYGEPLPAALRSFADRVVSIDARFFVTAVLTQRETGGNLSEILERLASVMRDRFRIKREVRVRSAHGRISAFVLAGLPPSLAFIMLSSAPENMKLLTSDPIGIRITLIAVTLQVIGVLIVRKLVDIKY